MSSKWRHTPPSSPSMSRRTLPNPNQIASTVITSTYTSNRPPPPRSPARQKRRESSQEPKPDHIKPAITRATLPSSSITSTSSNPTISTSRHSSNKVPPGSPRPEPKPSRARSQSLPITTFSNSNPSIANPHALAESTLRRSRHVLWTTQKETLVNTPTTTGGTSYIYCKDPITNNKTKHYDSPSTSLTKITNPPPSFSTSTHSSPSPTSSSAGLNYLFKSHNSTDVTSTHKKTQSFDSSLTTRLPPIIKNKTTNSTTGIQSSLSTPSCGLVGLYNSGNSCYMNSVLQCLSLTNDLTNYFLSGTFKNEKPRSKRTPITDAYGNFLESKSKSDKAIAPSYLRSVMSSQILMVRTTEQQDAQEFLLYLLCCIHEEMNIPTGKPSSHSCTNLSNDRINQAAAEAWRDSLAFDNSFLSKLFMGQIRSTLTCVKCNNVVTNFETFWSLSLPLPRPKSKYTTIVSTNASISDCFRLYSSEEKLDNDNKPMCTRCKSPQTSKKKLSVQVFPDVLILHLKRFTVQCRYSTKLSTNVQVPSILNVEEIAADRESVKSFHYELYGVINHSGSISFGHYKADCKYNEKWYCFNDKNVSSSSESYVTSPSPMPYVLFYQKKNS